MTAADVVLFDYGSGNVHSALKALQHAGANVTLTRDRKAALAAAGLVVPGVGAFAAVMGRLNDSGAPAIIDQRIAAGKSVLGICVGMQVMFENGHEHGIASQGLGQWPGSVTALVAERLPHIGWNKVSPAAGSRLFSGVERERFYFVHSYAAKHWSRHDAAPFRPAVLTTTHYGEEFLSAVEDGPLVATQFHPEKSGPAGLRLLENWIRGL